MLANQYVGDNIMIPICLSAQHYNDTAERGAPFHPLNMTQSESDLVTGDHSPYHTNLPLSLPTQHFAATCLTLSNGRASSVLQQHGVSDSAIIFRNGNIIIIMLCHAQ